MINFHKFGFLDINKIQRFTKEKDFWLCQYNSTWLFIWTDYYKIEIAYDNKFCYIRFMMPNVGMCYYPPLGEESLEVGIKIIQEDCKENGFDFYLASVDERLVPKLEKLNLRHKIVLYQFQDFSSYIHYSEDLAFFKSKKLKLHKSNVNKFEKEHKNIFSRQVKKDDFPSILEFLEVCRQKANINANDPMFFTELNAVNKCMEHLYELNLLAVILRDEEKIYGLAIGSIKENVAYEHIELALPDVIGAKEKTVMSFAKTAMLNARYINREMDLGNIDTRKNNESYHPLKLENFYASFRL